MLAHYSESILKVYVPGRSSISTSIAPHERLEAIQKTKEALDHENQRGHDEEIASGADSVLVKHLTFILSSTQANHQQHQDSDSEMTMTELSLTLECLELLYRADSVIVGASFRRMGPMLLQLLRTIITDEIGRRMTTTKQHHNNLVVKQEPGLKKDPTEESHTDEEQHDSRSNTPTTMEVQVGTPEGDILLKKATRIFGHFARVGEATKPMAHFPGFIEGLENIVTLKPYDNLPWEARLSALWCIANLACNGDNMEMMVRVPGLIPALIDISHRPLHHDAGLEHTMDVLRARSIASRAILNLSWSPGNKQKLASNTDLTKVALCNYNSGHLLDVLTEAALNDPDQSTVDRAFAAIHNLANHDTAAKIVSHPALVMALKDVLMSAEASDHQEGTPKSHAAATLMVLERSISPDMPEYENLKGLLEAMNPESNSSDDIDSEMEPMGVTAV